MNHNKIYNTYIKFLNKTNVQIKWHGVQNIIFNGTESVLVMQVVRDLDLVNETGISSNIGILPKFKSRS